MLSIRATVGLLATALLLPPLAAQNTRPKAAYHWHMHQPIYWNTRLSAEVDRYEYAWESIQATDAGRPNPENDLRQIFGDPNRVAVYQWRTRDALQDLLSHPNAGAQMSYTGALMENVHSLGQARQLGYTPSWHEPIRQAMDWTTSGGQPRMDLVNISFHHALLPLHNEETVYMELRLHQEKVKEVFGEEYISRGLFPTEMAFSTRLIPVLDRLGIEWTIVSGEKIARATPDFPVVLGQAGINNEPPNPADMLNPPGEEFIRRQISRGISPVNANPLSYQPAYVSHVDPFTGETHSIIAVPADQAQGWVDGAQCIGYGFLAELEARNDPKQPSLVLLAHDGDNFFGGGYSYYHECVPQTASGLAAQGNEITTIEQYLTDFPPDPVNLIHVEDGAWVNADGDFGSPTYINWNYPLIDPSGAVDPEEGWHEKVRDMAIFTATLNRVLTAEQISGHEPDFSHILHPRGDTHPVDRAWHYHLGSLDSGNVYFGPILDLPIKATIGANDAVRNTDILINGHENEDKTPPTIWLPQRFPYNPGGRNFGIAHGYEEVFDDGDFHIWTFIYDVNGPAEAVLRYRLHEQEGVHAIGNTATRTYEGGEGVGDWMEIPMNRREFPSDNVFNRPELDLWVLPEYIADHYWVKVEGLRDVTIDYYVKAEDTRGNVGRSPIQHVYIGDGEYATPAPPPGESPFPMDGSIDPRACELPGGLYLAEEDGWLYVATDIEGGDAFVYLTATEDAPLRSANWAKPGQVAEWDYFLGREADNMFLGWFGPNEEHLGAPDGFEMARSGWTIEGAIRRDLIGEVTVYTALGIYESPDGGALLHQVPETAEPDGNIPFEAFHPLVPGADPCTGDPVPPDPKDAWLLY